MLLGKCLVLKLVFILFKSSKGGKASGFRNSEDSKDTDKLGDEIMLQVRSYGHLNTKAIQVLARKIFDLKLI